MNERELRTLRDLRNEVRMLRQEIHAVHEDQQAARTNQQTHPIRPIPIEIESDPRIPIAIHEHYEAENSYRKSKWKKFITGLEIVGVVSAFAIAVLTLCNLNQITRQTGIMRDQLTLSQRPWLTFDTGITTPLKFDDGGMHLTLDIVLKATGNSPAVGVWVDPELYIANGKKPHRIVERERVCNEITKRSPTLGQTVFPSYAPTERYTVRATVPEMNESLDAFKTIATSVIACVAYRSVFSDSPFYTGAVYTLQNFDPITKQLTFLRPGEPVAPSQLGLILDPSGFTAK